MLFNSFVFWVFFAVVLLVYWRLPHRGQNRFLLVASYVFYGAWDWKFLSLIVLSTVVDYVSGREIAGTTDVGRRKRFLVLSLVTNLGLLGFFKYFGFFAEELNNLLAVFGVHQSLPVLNIILPVGISFYTFQTLSYTIDVYRGVTQPARDFLDFGLYVAFFPQLVAGPIERSSHLLPQVLRPRTLTQEQFHEGAHHILLGLFKKVVLADNLAPIANMIFARHGTDLSGFDVAVGVYAFAFQIYGDFSGYSSIAKGVAKWMGFDLMTNFALPYISRNPQEFWHRWHISLSSWLRDYLYIPLGGNRGSRLRTYGNLMTTMILGGLWHGAAWTFVVWGLYQGLLLAGHRFLDEARRGRRKLTVAGGRLRSLVSMVGMFHLACFGWLLFRADSMTQVRDMTLSLFQRRAISPDTIPALALIAFFAGPLFAYEAWIHRDPEPGRRLRGRWYPHAVAYAYFALMILLFPPEIASEFIYFQF